MANLAERPRPPPNRRRDKPQLSCDLCRRRKYAPSLPFFVLIKRNWVSFHGPALTLCIYRRRCDRSKPCGTCVRSGIPRSGCTYPSCPGSQSHHHAVVPSSSSESSTRGSLISSCKPKLKPRREHEVQDGQPDIDRKDDGKGISSGAGAGTGTGSRHTQLALLQLSTGRQMIDFSDISVHVTTEDDRNRRSRKRTEEGGAAGDGKDAGLRGTETVEKKDRDKNKERMYHSVWKFPL
ncbi:hypothetical protein QBC46DRAFT_399808 [Diplogelasinospora grovesii]|uniref:Uncharacterized protein n=1 Tax=Diplogelasinospora grovesii TaxID=303347 RepID=A0AAN6RZQ0_9PEZI|nr:hypothetical protein QBC46DRAFT_399808 [Diplogelasinospora grovesii]